MSNYPGKTLDVSTVVRDYDGSSMDATALTGVTFSAINQAGIVITAPSAMTYDVGTQVWRTTWTIPVTPPGNVEMIFTATDSGGGLSQSTHLTHVVKDALQADSWATVDDVAAVTGVTVTDTVLMQAQAAIDVFAARSTAARPRLLARDQYWLRLAVAYQAAWLSAQPDPFTRSDVNNVSQDGISLNFAAAGLVLAPMAKRAMRRLRWKGTRSLQTQAPFERRFSGDLAGASAVAAVFDTYGEHWVRL